MSAPREFPTEDFRRAFSSHSAGCRSTCACGRTFFDTSGALGWEDGEFETLLQSERENPDVYRGIPHSVSRYCVDGKEYVWDCDCGGAVEVERLIRSNADEIADYLNAWAKLLREKAERITVQEVKP